MTRLRFRKGAAGSVHSALPASVKADGARFGRVTGALGGTAHELAFITPNRARAQSPYPPTMKRPAFNSGVLSQSASRHSKAQPGAWLPIEPDRRSQRFDDRASFPRKRISEPTRIAAIGACSELRHERQDSSVGSEGRAGWPPIAARRSIAGIRSRMAPHYRLATEPGLAESGTVTKRRGLRR